MKLKKWIAAALIFCLTLAALSPAAAAADLPDAGELIDRLGGLTEEGLSALTDWFEGQTAKLAPELRETLRDADTEALFSDFKALTGQTAGMDDDALRAAILALAEKHGIHLVDSQTEQIMGLCRAMEKLDARQLNDRLEALRHSIQPPAGLRAFWDSVVQALADAADWIAKTLGGLFG